jgi:hypothetical protein
MMVRIGIEFLLLDVIVHELVCEQFITHGSQLQHGMFRIAKRISERSGLRAWTKKLKRNNQRPKASYSKQVVNAKNVA